MCWLATSEEKMSLEATTRRKTIAESFTQRFFIQAQRVVGSLRRGGCLTFVVTNVTLCTCDGYRLLRIAVRKSLVE